MSAAGIVPECAMCGIPRINGVCPHCDGVCTGRDGYERCPACVAGDGYDGAGPKTRPGAR